MQQQLEMASRKAQNESSKYYPDNDLFGGIIDDYFYRGM